MRNRTVAIIVAMSAYSGPEARESLLADINAITGVGLQAGMVDKWPSVKSDLLSAPDVLEKLLARLKEAMGMARP